MRYWYFFWVFQLIGFNALASELDRQRLDFLQAEQALNQQKIPEFLAAIESLSDYPLYPVLKAQWLKQNLDQTEQIKAFLERFPDNRYAEHLRTKWLHFLADQGRWSEYKLYFRDSDALDLQCLFNQAQYVTGQPQATLAAARYLWLQEIDLPTECQYVLSVFQTSTEFSIDLIWKRFDLALQHNKVNAAERLVSLFKEADQETAKFWLHVHANPDLINSPKMQEQPTALKGLIFSDAIARMGIKSPSFASLIWDTKAKTYDIDAAHRQKVEHDLALALAKQKSPVAFAHLMQVTQVDDEIKEWRVRSALQELNWAHVVEAVASLEAKDQQLPKWQYWQARALWLQDKKDQALPLFRQLASKRDYYGFLAADYADQTYQLQDKPLVIAPDAIADLLNQDALKIVQELRYFHREKEAQAQWWSIIKRLPKDKITVAAKIAQQWRWRPIDIFTIVKAEHWDDVNLRFPLMYQETVQQNAAMLELDPALVYGLIRQESAFDLEAASPVGARGLMQIMPATAKQIAQELNEAWNSSDSLFNPELNIKYGAYYYNKLVHQFYGHYALATAAYNAGPKRVESWLPEQRSVPADIWIETIPYKETRKYVSAVLAYAVIYQQRLQKNNFRISDFMSDVLPL